MTIGRLAQENDAYRRARNQLLEAEIALRDQRERVAALRRALPLDTEIEDYVLQQGPADLSHDAPIEQVRLSQLFEQPDKPLVLYQFMYGGAQSAPCPMCTLWVDGFNGVGHHIRQQLNFAIIGRAEIGALRALARERGWCNLRMVSSAGSTYKADHGFEDAEGNQLPGLSVYVRGADGAVRHFYSGSAILGPDQYRGLDLFAPMWSLLDLTPTGRGDWMPSLAYEQEKEPLSFTAAAGS